MSDPIERNLAQQGQGSGIISQNTNYFVGPYPLTRGQYDDANNGGGGGPDPGDPDPNPPTEPLPPPTPELAVFAFFSQSGSPNDGSLWTFASQNCSFERPCGPNDFTQDNVNAFSIDLPGTSISFSPGTYPAIGTSPTDPLILVAGQGIYGRTTDYQNPAPSTDRPIFSGTLQLNTGNIVSDVKSIYPGGVSPTTGISLAQGAVGIVIENSQVGSESVPAQRFNVGIGSAGLGPFNNEAVIKEVTIFAGNTGINFGGPSLIVRESVINAGGGPASESSGVRSTGQNATIQLDTVTIDVSSSTASTLYGLQAGFIGTTMTANNVTMQLNASASGAEASALYVGLTDSGNPTNLTVNVADIISRSLNGSAFIASSTNTAGNVSVIEINSGQLEVEAASTAEIKNSGSIFDLSIDGLSSCSIGGTLGVCP